MIVAITGGTGFIGRKLVLRHLARGDEVRVLSRRNPGEAGLPELVKWYRGELSGSGALLSFVEGVDVLYHCAGEIRDVTRMEATHVDGTRRLIEVAAGKIGRWVQLSSVGAYGKYREGVVTEETSLKPCGIYEVTKAKSDMLVEAAGMKGVFGHVILRPSIVYGEEMANRSLFNLIAMIQRGWFFFIGKPGASANYIHVDNVIEALLLCGTMSHACGKIYNLSDHRTMEDFIATLAKALGRKISRLRLPETPVRLLAMVAGIFPGAPLTETKIDALTSRVIYPADKIEQELGYRHVVSMEDGLTWLVDSWKREVAGVKG